MPHAHVVEALPRGAAQGLYREHGGLLPRRGQGLRASAQGGGATHAIAPAQSCYVNAIDRIGAGAASWIVEVLPSGKPGRVVLENFVPNPDVAGAMRDCLDRYTFAPFAGDAPATIRVSMVMGSPEGAAISRKRRR